MTGLYEHIQIYVKFKVKYSGASSLKLHWISQFNTVTSILVVKYGLNYHVCSACKY